MAASILLTSGSVLAGSPVVAKVQSEALSVAYTFYRIVLRVTVGTRVYDLAAACTPGDAVSFDISPCLRSAVQMADDAPITAAGTRTYPVYEASLVAYANYVSSGEEVMASIALYNSGDPVRFIRGRWSDEERAGQTTLDVQALTTKPATPEYVGEGDMVVVPQRYDEAVAFPATTLPSPTSIAAVATYAAATDGLTTIEGRHFQVLPFSDRDRVAVQFINSRGVHESASLLANTSGDNPAGHVTSSVSSETYDVIPPTAFGCVLRRGKRVTGSGLQLALTTDWLTEEWAWWYAHELLEAERAWVLFRGKWHPCHFEADGGVTSDNTFRIGLTAVLDW